MAHSEVVKEPEDFGTDEAGVVRRWQAEWEAAGKYFEDYLTMADKAVKRYRDENPSSQRRSDYKGRAFNVFWSTEQTLMPLTYSKTPKAEVQRKWKDADPQGRAAAELLERTLDNIVDVESFEDAMIGARDDYLLAARGTTWWRYVPTYGDDIKGEDGEPVLNEETGKPLREVVSEKAEVEHIHYRNFRHQPAPRWSKVTWVGKEELMTREQLVERFGEAGKDVPLTHTVGAMKKSDAEKYGDVFMRAAVREIWDKTRREVIWIAEGHYKKWLDRKKDPLGLEDFFPCPKPCYGTMTTDSTAPVTDYHEWRHQLAELDELTERISLLTSALKVSGVYNQQLGDEIADLLSARLENRLVPVDNWAMFQEGGGFKGNVSFIPLKEVAEALIQLTAQRERLKQDFFEVSGVADIMRGQSDPRETKGAQQIKARFGSVRIEERQARMQKFVRANLRIAAEIAGEHFSTETFDAMANWLRSGREDAAAMFAGAMQILKSDKARGFRVDIETDSTIAPDRIAEQDSRTKFLAAMTPFLERVIPATQQYPALGKLFAEILMFGVRGYAVGRSVESAFEQAIGNMEAQGPEASPQAQAEQAKMQLEGRKIDAEVAKIQAEIQNDQMKLQIEGARLEMERRKLDGAADGEMATRLAQNEAALRDKAAELQLRQEELDLKRLTAEAAAAKDRYDADLKAEELEMKRKDMETKNRLAMIQAAMENDLSPDMEGVFEGKAEEVGQSIRGAMTVIAEGQQAQAHALAEFAEAQARQTDSMIAALQALAESMQGLAAATTAPRRVLRDDDGRIVGAEVAVQ